MGGRVYERGRGERCGGLGSGSGRGRESVVLVGGMWRIYLTTRS